MTTNKAHLLHIDEAAQALNLSVSNMYRLAREGKIPSMRVGKRWLFDIDTIIGTMMSQSQRKPPTRAPLPGIAQAPITARKPVPGIPAPNPDEVMAQARLVLQHAAEAVQQAAKVMAAVDEARRKARSVGNA